MENRVITERCVENLSVSIEDEEERARNDVLSSECDSEIILSANLVDGVHHRSEER